MFSGVAVDSYCKEKENFVVLAHLLQKASV
jgi:hypothetical protein